MENIIKFANLDLMNAIIINLFCHYQIRSFQTGLKHVALM